MTVLQQRSGLVVSQPPGGGTASAKEIWFTSTDYNANHNGGSFRAREITAAGAFNFVFYIPDDFVALSLLTIDSIPDGTNAAADIDLISEYGAVGELYNTHTESDLGTLYSYVDNVLFSIDLSVVFSSILAGDRCGVNVDHNNIVTPQDYIGIHMVYT